MESLPFDSERGRAYIEKQGRPLEAARAKYLFDEGPVEAVAAELQAYANEDGGFGHGLEPDLWGKASSVVATRLAFEIFDECSLSYDDPLVSAALEYLRSTYNKSRHDWPISNVAASLGPHAPWWNLEEGSTEIYWEENPTPEILGYLLRFRSLPECAWIDAILQEIELGTRYMPTETNMHALNSWFVLVRSKHLSDKLRYPLIQAFEPLIEQTLCLDPSQWTTYCLRPLDIVPSPNDPLRDLVPDAAIQANLEFLAAEQREDGGWHPTWSWGKEQQEFWRKAEQCWSGYLTLRALKIFSNWL